MLEVVLCGHIQTRILNHLRPGCRLENVVTLEMDCSKIGKIRSVGFYLNKLRRSEDLQLLRLYGYASLSVKDIGRFNQYGLQSGVEVEWAGKDTWQPSIPPYPIAKFDDSDSGEDTDETLSCTKHKHEEDSSFGTNVNIRQCCYF